MDTSRVDAQVSAAIRAIETEDATPAEKVEMLMEIAMGIQQRPRTPADLAQALVLYRHALELCPADAPLLTARVRACLATALLAAPGGGTDSLEAARDALEQAIPALKQQGLPEEVAEAEMNLGLALQSLAGAGRGRITDSIAAYQRALRVFDRAAHPKEFAILQNNLATAFLAIPMTDERARMREALAVQSFEEGLKVVTLIDHPVEYAMLQNNLGNALQYASSSHAVENNLRALEAYDEALRVRTPATAALPYANTIANKANCLLNLPDDPARPAFGNRANLKQAQAYLDEARAIFLEHGEIEKARLVAETLQQVVRELLAAADNGGGRAEAVA
ncbi:MAG: hypothetical protein AB7S71_17530 [Dongiaceae bacterium]